MEISYSASLTFVLVLTAAAVAHTTAMLVAALSLKRMESTIKEMRADLRKNNASN
jgi:hypothetical protein